MATKDMKTALGNSMRAEESAVRDRFAQAETLLARNDVSESQPHGKNGNIPEEDREPVKRDSFTMPLTEYEQIATLQKRCLKMEKNTSKSEILRCGLVALAALSDEELAEMLTQIPKIKTGRRPGHTV